MGSKQRAVSRRGVWSKNNKSAPRPEMDHIDYGLSVLSSGAIRTHPAPGALPVAPTSFTGCQRGARRAAFEVTERFYEIGSPEGLRDAEAYFWGLESA